MSDSTRQGADGRSIPASAAFANLPLERPAASVWRRIEGTRARRRSTLRRHAPAWLAVAASVALLAVLLPGRLALSPMQDATMDPVAGPGPDVAPRLEIDHLVATSTRLEAALSGAPPALRSSGDVLTSQWLAADIAALDLALAEATPEQDTSDLWRQRIALLDAWLQLNRHEQWVAAGGNGNLANPPLVL